MTTARISRIWGIILLAITICLISFPAYAQYSGGTGEPNDPYQIATAEDLMLLGETPEDYDKHFILTADIDLDPNLPGRKVFDRAVIASDIDPVPNKYGYQLYDGAAFTGMFDGNGHTISKLTISGNSYLALFGQLDFPAEVNNLGLVDVNIAGSGWFIGGVAGANGTFNTPGGSVTNCYSIGTVSGDLDVGGLVGENVGQILDCYSKCTVDGNAYVGGLVGKHNVYTLYRPQSGNVTHSYSTSTVSGNQSVGGLVGYNESYVDQCFSISNVSGGSIVGGLVGWNFAGTISNSYSTGSVIGDSFVGGLTGENGGLVFMGAAYGVINNSYSISVVVGTESVGGLLGEHIDGEVTNSFWDIQTSGQTTSYGHATGKTTAEMQTASTFLEAGWDFVDETANGSEDIWKIAEGVGYPRLWWEKYSGGIGEPNDPYQIATATDLIALGETPEDYDKHFILTADIDLDPNLAGGKVFGRAVIAPKGEAPFTGVFDGDDHAISRLTIKGEESLGLFGQLGPDGYVKNVGVVDVNITGTDCVGGMVGDNWGATVTQCSSTGSVSGTTDIGGLVGCNRWFGTNGILSCCSSAATVRGYRHVGGLMGNNDEGNVNMSYSTGTINGIEDVGGLAGRNLGIITNSYATGSVWGDLEVGGLVGLNDWYQWIDYSEASGWIIRCYSASLVFGITQVGGLVGETYYYRFEKDPIDRVTACFWDIQTSGQTMSDGGIGMTTAEMQDPNTFVSAGWEFAPHDVWFEPEGGGYPILWWQLPALPALPPFSGGVGKPADPYLISTAEELNNIGHNTRLMGCHFRLVNDIDLRGIDFYPIGNLEYPYCGVFDGDGHTISNLTMEGDGYLGLFGRLAYGAEVRDLGMAAVDISGSGDYLGGLVGQNDGRVIRCWSTGVVNGYSHIGGLVGENLPGGEVICCHSLGDVNGQGYYNRVDGDIAGVGGLVGTSGGTVSESYSMCAVIGDVLVGGLCGLLDGGSATDCYAGGMVSGSVRTGGLVGSCRGGVLTRCYSSTGVISGHQYQFVGGLVGLSLYCNMIESFWDIQTSGQTTSAQGTGKTTAEMMMAATFTTWDFETTWTIQDGIDYPRLQWEVYGIPAPVPTTIEKLSADNRCGVAGAMLFYPLTISVKDQDGTVMVNEQVEFEVTEGGGIVEPASTVTDANGIASTQLTLGPVPGLNQVRAFVGNLSVDFNITGLSAGYGGGIGEPNEPYQIWTAEQMDVIGASPNDWDKHFTLMADIDLSIFDGKDGRCVFNTIGTNFDNTFTGVFYGNGMSILNINSTIFGSVHGTIQDVCFADPNCAGSPVGSNYGTIARCCVQGGKISGAGGLVSENNGDITHCYSTAQVSGSYAGGLVGRNMGFGNVTYCYSAGEVTGNSARGLVGDRFGWTTELYCVWDTQTSGQTKSTGGVGLTTSEMMDPDMLGLNGFANDPNWVLDAGMDYPRLVWEDTPGQVISESDIDWLDGDGTVESPYQIGTAEQLIVLSRASALWGKDFILNADVDLDPNLQNEPIFEQAPIQFFAGIFDGNNHTISHLYVTGESRTGLFGRLASGQVMNLGVVDVNIVGSDWGIGGLVAYNDSGSVINCFSTGAIKAGGGFYAGGIVGYNVGSVTGCYSTATVSNALWSVGGLIGYNGDNVQQSYSTGLVSGSMSVGGLIGENGGSVAMSYSTGEVWGYYSVGGLVGDDYSWSQADRCFWDTQTSGRAWSAGGTGKTTSQMKRTATFTDWDFENIWIIDEGLDYPKLRWAIALEQEKYGGGIGTSYNPYQIWTAEQMNDIGRNPPDWVKYFRLMADIDLGVYTGATFNIIGVSNSYGPPFSGVFDGNGKTISNFTLYGSIAPSQGLFGAVEGEFALIENLTLKGANISAGSKGIVGALVGYLHSGTISGCQIEGTSVSGDHSVGGIVGICNGTVANCSSSANVSVSDSIAGGLIGQAQRASIITACSSTAQVSGRSFAGGVTGENQGSIENCCSTAQASATKGGAGGLVAINNGTIRNCYSNGRVSAPSSVGGLVGSAPGGGSTSGSFWDTQTSGQTWSAGGTGKTTAQMKLATTFTGWDFENIWTIHNRFDYPKLRWTELSGSTPPVQGSIITSVLRSNGESDNRAPVGQYNGSTPPLPTEAGGLINGNLCFSDRTYTWTKMPEQLLGAEYVRTFNSDKHSTTVTYTVTTSRTATFMIAVDDRINDLKGAVNQATARFAPVGMFEHTVLNLYSHENASTDRPLSVFTAELPAGTYVFSAMPSGHNFYIIAAMD